MSDNDTNNHSNIKYMSEERSGYRNGHLIYPISILDHKPKGGGGGMQPGPNTVGTDEIIDNSIEMVDLNDSVKNKIQKTYDEDDETLHMDFDEADVNGSQNQNTGFDTQADDGEDDV